MAGDGWRDLEYEILKYKVSKDYDDICIFIVHMLCISHHYALFSHMLRYSQEINLCKTPNAKQNP